MSGVPRAVAVIGLTALFSGCNAWTLPALRTCEMDALKNFGALRKPNEHGVFWPPHPLEYYYISSCMRASGFILEERSDIDVGRVGDGLRATYMLNADNWKLDYKKWLPKSVREWVP
jgi:hypothetical protein